MGTANVNYDPFENYELLKICVTRILIKKIRNSRLELSKIHSNFHSFGMTDFLTEALLCSKKSLITARANGPASKRVAKNQFFFSFKNKLCIRNVTGIGSLPLVPMCSQSGPDSKPEITVNAFLKVTLGWLELLKLCYTTNRHSILLYMPIFLPLIPSCNNNLTRCKLWTKILVSKTI